MPVFSSHYSGNEYVHLHLVLDLRFIAFSETSVPVWTPEYDEKLARHWYDSSIHLGGDGIYLISCRVRFFSRFVCVFYYYFINLRMLFSDQFYRQYTR